MIGERPPPAVLGLAAVAALFFGLPLLALVLRAPWRQAAAALTDPAALAALQLSLVTSLSACALAFLLGVPLAWVFARGAFPGLRLLRALTTLPMVLPPVVGGVALLLAYGRRGLAGGPLFAATGFSLPFTTPAVVLAEAFVAMPFLVLTVEAGMRGLDGRLEEAARTLGAGRWHAFRTVTLPLLAPSLAAGGAVAWARALGEFGATITFAGNLPGATQTAPLAVYLLLETDPAAAILLSLLLLGLSLAVLAALRDRWLTA